jgi:hypothetical protein
LQKLRAGTGVRFKVQHTEGKNTGWYLEMPTREQIDGCFYEAPSNLQSGGVTEINIPYSSLRQPDWGFQRRFNPGAIASIMIRRTGEGSFNAAGSSTIKIFDFEIYNEPAAAPQTTTSQSTVTPATPAPAPAPAQAQAQPERRGFIYDAAWTSDVNGGNAAVKNNSSTTFQTARETIQGHGEKDVLTITVNLARGNEWRLGQLLTNDEEILNRLRGANGIRFKALGDGAAGWLVQFPTQETSADNCQYETSFRTRRDQVVEINIPYSGLKQPSWGRQVRFNRENILCMNIQRYALGDSAISGTSTIKLFDFEIY